MTNLAVDDLSSTQRFTPTAASNPFTRYLSALFSGDTEQAELAMQELAQLQQAAVLQYLSTLDPEQLSELVQAVNSATAMQNQVQAPSAFTRTPRAPAERHLSDAQLRSSTDGSTIPGAKVYKPGSPEAVALFREAARQAGVPESWASSRALHNLLARESGGTVGRPNYTYGRRANDRSQWPAIWDELKHGHITAKSSASGLGQLLLRNVDRYYPSGRAGIGDPLEEATGMLRYIKANYGSPERAWKLYNTRHEGY